MNGSPNESMHAPRAGAWLPLHPRWPPLRAGQSLVLPLPADAFAELPPQRTVDSLQLRRKREFHATLIDTATTAALREALRALPAREAARWRRAAMALDWRWRRLGECWLLARSGGGKPQAHSVIERLEQPAQQAFRVRVGALLGRALPPPVPHVTLYTEGDAGGIGLPDPDAFHARRVRRLQL